MRPRRFAFVFALVLGCAKASECGLDSDCHYGERCSSGLCVRGCRLSIDCNQGEKCNAAFGLCEGLTKSPADGGIGGNEKADGNTSDGREVAASYLDSCAVSADCESGLCLANPFSGQTFCSALCESSSDCTSTDVCIGPEGGVRGCLTADTGHSCSTSSPESCLFGLCLASGPGDGLCTRECTSALDCPAGYTCSTVNGAGAEPRVCVQVDRRCPGGPGDCASGLCWENTICVGDCRYAADCPPNHTCQAVGSTNVCLPNAGLGGLGETCTAANQCRSGLCVDFCTTPCAVTRGAGQLCPGGWGCNPVTDTNIGGLSLVCARAGLGEIGEPCVDNEDCLTGLCITTERGETLCSRFCNDGFCPSAFVCEDAELTASGVALMACI